MEYKSEYICGKCGEIIDYENYTWRDASGTKHIVCVECNEVLEEDYPESDYPEAEIFKF